MQLKFPSNGAYTFLFFNYGMQFLNKEESLEVIDIILLLCMGQKLSYGRVHKAEDFFSLKTGEMGL
jgi:hypothetical protein